MIDLMAQKVEEAVENQVESLVEKVQRKVVIKKAALNLLVLVLTQLKRYHQKKKKAKKKKENVKHISCVVIYNYSFVIVLLLDILDTSVFYIL